jgi:adenylate kinase
MIIFLDGTYGIGKTSVVSEIKKKVANDELVFINADFWFRNMCDYKIHQAKKEATPKIGGMFPQTNITFIRAFQKRIAEKIKDENMNILVDMALTSDDCKELILDYFTKIHRNVLHIILIAEEDTIRRRIIHDVNRAKPQALYAIKRNLDFLKDNYGNAQQINTENRTIIEVAQEVIEYIKCKGNFQYNLS